MKDTGTNSISELPFTVSTLSNIYLLIGVLTPDDIHNTIEKCIMK